MYVLMHVCDVIWMEDIAQGPVYGGMHVCGWKILLDGRYVIWMEDIAQHLKVENVGVCACRIYIYIYIYIYVCIYIYIYTHTHTEIP
jgi:hypothetical protein